MRSLLKTLLGATALSALLAFMAAPASAQHIPENWKRVNFSVDNAACGTTVTCEFGDINPWNIRLDYAPSHGGGFIGAWQCSGSFDGVLDGDGSVDVADAAWDGGGFGSPCYQGVSQPYQLGDYPSQGQACYHVPEDAYYIRLPISIDRDGTPTDWYDGHTFGRLDMSSGISWGVGFGGQPGTSKFNFPTETGIVWSHSGSLAFDQAVEPTASEDPCPWPELA